MLCEWGDGLRGKKAIINIISSSALQVVTLLCGLIVPRIIIGAYGSQVNGMMNSIAQFLGYIVLLESGVGSVVRSALYKPLADNDGNKISSIVNASEVFFRKICFVFMGYSVLMACVYPFMVNSGFDYWFIFFLSLIIAISTVSQYYFAMPYQLLTQADQKRYIPETAQALTLVFNAIAVVICVKLGVGVHFMKLASSLVFALRPIAVSFYVKKKYSLNKSVAPDNSALNQRFDGLAHHIAFFIHLNTDVVVLTLFSKISQAFSIAEVSVYSVYYSVVYGVEKLSNILHQAVEAAFGNMLAKGESLLFKKNFRVYEQLSLMLNTFVFTCAGVLVVPFVSVYTQGVTDADYNRPVFAIILTLAEAMYCLRKPYNNVVLAAGHFKQTKNGAIFEAALNVVLSVILVIPFGLTGVAVATLISMSVRTLEFTLYLYKNLLKESILTLVPRLGINLISCAVTVFITRLIGVAFVNSYFTFFVYAILVAVICGLSVLIINLVFYYRDVKSICSASVKAVKNFIK